MPKPKAKSKVVLRPLLDVLRESKKPMSPEQLFKEAGYEDRFKETRHSQEVVDRFYLELRQLTEPPSKIKQHKRSQNVVLLEALP